MEWKLKAFLADEVEAADHGDAFFPDGFGLAELFEDFLIFWMGESPMAEDFIGRAIYQVPIVDIGGVIDVELKYCLGLLEIFCLNGFVVLIN
jgi:hypothetical protein